MPAILPIVVPLACACLYVLAALMLKRASLLGVGPWRIGFLANWIMLLVFLPGGWFWPGPSTGAGPWWQPALNALFFLLGQLFIFLALQKGEVSVATPVMGTKVVLVALLSLVLHAGAVPLRWWVGALLSAAAVALLHFGEPSEGRGRVGRTVLLAGLSALSFSLCDVLMQKWAAAWGGGRYVLLLFAYNAAYSIALLPFARASLLALDRRAWAWTTAGALLLAINNVGIAVSIAVWRAATLTNILYSLRGLVSVALVWTIGHWFANTERHGEARVLWSRIAGAGLFAAAVAIVLA